MHLKPLISLLFLGGFIHQVAADLSVLGAGEPDRVPDTYIVVLKPSINATQVEEHTYRISTYHRARNLEQRASTAGISGGFDISSTGPAFRGYSVHCDKRTLREILRSPEVKYVEQEAITSIAITQKSSTWGLSRISWRNLPSSYSYRYQATWAGRGTTIYVADTGVRITHKEFEGRAKWGYNAVPGTTNTDKNGHGTHVSGTAAGKTYGVAKQARIVAVKILNDQGRGTSTYTVKGLDWIGKNAKPYRSVVNMSISGTRSQAVNDAVEALYRKRIVVVVAAGNDGDLASRYSPASAPNAITVGATDDFDWAAYFTNYGTALDVFAPGVNVLSAWSTSDTAVRYDDGTSMASPHVAGLAAYFISSKATNQTPTMIRNVIVAKSLKNYISYPGTGSANRLAYNGFA